MNKEERKAYDKVNIDSQKVHHKKWHDSHRDKCRTYSKAYYQLNKKKYNAYRRKRCAALLQRIPGWLTPKQDQQIKDFYLNCPEGMQVDHICPLQGKLVSGLHHPDNLQYLTPEENCSKGNR